SLERRHHGSRMALLGQPGFHEADWDRSVTANVAALLQQERRRLLLRRQKYSTASRLTVNVEKLDVFRGSRRVFASEGGPKNNWLRSWIPLLIRSPRFEPWSG